MSISHIEELCASGQFGAFATTFYKVTMLNKDELIVVDDGYRLYEMETGNELSEDLNKQFYATLRSASAKNLYARLQKEKASD